MGGNIFVFGRMHAKKFRTIRLLVPFVICYLSTLLQSTWQTRVGLQSLATEKKLSAMLHQSASFLLLSADL